MLNDAPGTLLIEVDAALTGKGSRFPVVAEEIRWHMSFGKKKKSTAKTTYFRTASLLASLK